MIPPQPEVLGHRSQTDVPFRPEDDLVSYPQLAVFSTTSTAEPTRDLISLSSLTDGDARPGQDGVANLVQ